MATIPVALDRGPRIRPAPAIQPAAELVLDRVALACLWSLILVIPWEGNTTMAGFVPSHWLGLLVVLVAALRLAVRGRVRRLTPVHYMMAAFVAWCGLTYLWTADREMTASRIGSYLLPSLVWRRGIVAAHTVHNLAERETDRAGRMIHKLAFRRFVVPVAVSRAVARSVAAFYAVPEPCTIPNGVPVSGFQFDSAARAQWRRAQGFDRDSFLFIATGRLEPQKNPLLLLRAFAALEDPRCHLLFVGDGPLRSRLQEQILLLRLEGRVHLLGRRADVREFLAAADAFVLSSDWEGNPLGLMEAMSGGLPVVATAVGGVPELVDNGRHGLLVEAGNAVDLSGAMRSLFDSADLRRTLGEAARRRAQAEFTLERMVDAYGRLYRMLLDRVTAEPKILSPQDQSVISNFGLKPPASLVP